MRAAAALLSLAASVVAVSIPEAGARAQEVVVTHVAGAGGGGGAEDGAGTTARFSRPFGVAFAPDGTVYVADTGNHVIRRVDRDGSVSTLAGRAGVPGSADGAPGQARFNGPRGLAMEASGSLVVLDTGNHVVRRVSPTGWVTTVAGAAGQAGTDDGQGTSARFRSPSGVVVDRDGTIFLTDTGNHTVRRMTPGGTVTTLAGEPGNPGGGNGFGGDAQFSSPAGIGIDLSGLLVVADSGNNVVRRLTTASPAFVTTLAGGVDAGTADGTLVSATFNQPTGLAVDRDGLIYVTDAAGHTLRRIRPDADVVSTVAGAGGVPGSRDGQAEAARFFAPAGLAADAVGNVAVADLGNATVRRVDRDANVATLAGSAPAPGTVDGSGAAARFDRPAGICLDGTGYVYVADTGSHTLRRMDAARNVVTLAGMPGVAGAKDVEANGGTIPAPATFNGPTGLAAIAAGSLLVADTGNTAIRTVTPMIDVSAYAGKYGVRGATNGYRLDATFDGPTAVAIVGDAQVVADAQNHVIRRISADGLVSVLAGVAGEAGSSDGVEYEVRFRRPQGVAASPSGVVYVADTGNHTIRRIDASGRVTTLAGRAGSSGWVDGVGGNARFRDPRAVAVDPDGNVLVADTGNHVLRRVSPEGVVTTLAGLAGSPGAADGSAASARFSSPAAVTVEASGRILVVDTGNHAIRAVERAAIAETATIDAPTGPPGAARQLGASGGGASTWRWTVLRRPAGSRATPSDPGARTPTFVPDVSGLYVFELLASGSSGSRASSVEFLAVCSNSGSVSITRVDGAAGATCPGAPVTLEATAGYASYVWSDGQTGRRVVVRPTATTSYTVAAADAGGCIATSAPFLLEVTPALTDALIGLPGSEATCENAAGLTATAIAVGGGAASWQWGYRTVPEGPITPLPGRTASTYTIDASDFPAAGSYRLVCRVTPTCGAARTTGDVSIQVVPGRMDRIVPVVLDVDTGSARYRTELTLTNRGTSTAVVRLRYVAALGDRAGSGSVATSLPPGQVIVPDVVAYLREKGLPIPPVSDASPQQGGPLLVTFEGASSTGAVTATARTTAVTAPPQPAGRAGLAYGASAVCEGDASRKFVFGLRSDAVDRSNLAVYNTSGQPVTVRVSVVSGEGDGRTVVVRDALTLDAFGWSQVSRVLDGTGVRSGWAVVERVSSSGAFGAYGVVNDNATNDGTFIEPFRAPPTGGNLVVPVLVETPAFRSELILANRGPSSVTLTLEYRESLSPGAGPGGTTAVVLPAGRQLLVEDAMEFLRTAGVPIGPRGEAGYAGSLRIGASAAAPDQLFAGARVVALSPAGGYFGLFVPAVAPTPGGSGEAWVDSLRADSESRSNVAVVHVGSDSDGPVTLTIHVHDGDAGGIARGEPVTVVLAPGEWRQLGGLLPAAGVRNGWIRVSRASGGAPWVAYGVINDGAEPGERTGDGAYVAGVN